MVDVTTYRSRTIDGLYGHYNDMRFYLSILMQFVQVVGCHHNIVRYIIWAFFFTALEVRSGEIAH